MGTTLTGTTPQDTYDSLIKVTDNGPLSGTAKYLSDGLGNDSVLALSTTAVGVSETSPLGKLHVKTADTSVSSVSAQGNLLVLEDSENGLSILSSTAGAGYINFGDSDDNDVGMIIYGHSDNSMLFYANAAERMRISATGNVGIGTSSPASPLSVGGTAVYDLPASTANFSTADAGKFQLRLTSTAFNVDGNWVGLGMGYSENYMKTAIIARALDGAGRGTINFCLNTSSTSTNVSLADTRVTVTSNGLTFNGDTAAANALDDYEEGTWTMGLSFGGGTTGITYANNTGTYTKVGRKVTVNGYIGLSSKGSSTGAAVITGLPFTIPNVLANYAAASVYLDKVTFANQYQAIGNINTTNVGFSEITEAGAGSALNDANFANNSEIIVNFTYFV